MMTVLSLILATQTTGLTIDALDQLAVARDSTSLAAVSTFPYAETAFQFLKTGGVYGGGRSGWRVRELRDPVGGRRYAVFTTNLLCEDIGEQVFEIANDRLVAKVNEREHFNLRLARHEFDLSVDVSEKSVAISNLMTFRSLGAARPFFHLRLGPEWTVERIQDGNGRNIEFRQAGGTVSVARPLGEAFKLNVTYRAILNNPRLEAKFSSDEMLLAGACWWPSLARQASSSKTTFHIPADWTGFSHGTRISDSVSGERRTTVWENNLPIAVFSASAGRYTVVSEKIADTTFWSASTVETRETLALQNLANSDVIRFLSSVRKWPYPSWGVVITPNFPGGALEAYSYATYGQGWLPAVEPHEPSHTFFGGVIPNTYLKSLWNESFASFTENWYYREGVRGNRSDLRVVYREVPDITPAFRAQAAFTAGAETGGTASTIGYGRGGLVLDMLEHEIGPEAMRSSISDWMKNHPRGETAEWEDFEKQVSLTAKRDLTWFFDQWIRRPGWAEFDLLEPKIEQEPGGWITTTTIRFPDAPMRLRLEALVSFADGRNELVRMPLTTGAVVEDLKFKTKARPVSISFDPWQRVMRDYEPRSLPASLSRASRGIRAWVREGDEAMAEQLLGQRPRSASRELPENLERQVLIGDPRKSEGLAALLKRLPEPPVLQGNEIRWRGQSVNTSSGGFAAVLPLEDGKSCVLMFGTARLRPNFGEADAVLFDDLGRPLAATRSPSQSGPLFFRFAP